LPIQQKESYKWIAASNQSKTLLHQAHTITIVADRESDMYDLLATVPQQHVHLLLRSNANRQIETGGNLVNYLNNLPVMHQYNLMVRGDVRKSIGKRTATMDLKWGKVAVTKPPNCKNKELPKSKELYVVEAKEQNKKECIYWQTNAAGYDGRTAHTANDAGL
jgi:hypothetical protein